MAIDYSNWTDADLQALADGNYDKMSSDALKQLSKEEVPVGQGGEPGYWNKVGELGGQLIGVQDAYRQTMEPVLDTITSTPAMVVEGALGGGAIAKRYLDELAKKAMSRPTGGGAPGPVAPSPTPGKIEVPFSAGGGPRQAPSQQTFNALRQPEPVRAPVAARPEMPPRPVAPPQPSLTQRGGQLAQQMREIAASRVMPVVPQLMKGAGAIGAMLYSPELNAGEDQWIAEQRRRQGRR